MWILVGNCSTQYNTWVEFPFLIDGNLNLFKIRAPNLGIQSGGKIWLRSFYPTLSLFSEQWQAIYPKTDYEFFVLPNENIFQDIKKIQVNQYGYKNIGIVPIDLELYVWDESINFSSINQTINQTITTNTNEILGIVQSLQGLPQQIEQIQTTTVNTNQLSNEILTFITGIL